MPQDKVEELTEAAALNQPRRVMHNKTHSQVPHVQHRINKVIKYSMLECGSLANASLY